MLKLMRHQEECADYWVKHPRMFNHGDAGTGKTISSLTGYQRSLKGRLLVIAPLSILRPSWGADIDRAMPGFTWSVAHGSPKKREEAFKAKSDIVLMNHDGVKWLADNLTRLDGFSHCVVDEYPAFKNRGTQRSRAMRAIASHFDYLNLLSGTPNSNKITDVWHPCFMLDGGQRLGDNFFRFQQQVCEGRPIPGVQNAVEWTEKDGAREIVAQLLGDLTIRHTLTDCVDIPENTRHVMSVEMPATVMRQYRQLERDAVLALEQGVVTAVHAGSKTKKILQLLSGAVYDGEGKVLKVHPHRYELVIDLVDAREHSVVAFNWRHEREELVRLAESRKISYAVIDGSVPAKARNDIVERYQTGEIRVIFAHPQSAGHGLTLTRGTTTIWASPTYNAEHYVQFNARIYRKGQTQKTETICICAAGTREEDVYDKLEGKITRMADLLALFAQQTNLERAA